MRIILIIQFVIIALGAYYIYTLSNAEEVKVVPAVAAIPVVETTKPVYREEVASTTEIKADTTTSVSGGTDVGMEYPILDGEAEAQ